jgi:hypothetical protein
MTGSRVRVPAHKLRSGHEIRIEHHRVGLTKVDWDKIPTFICLTGTYYEAPDFGTAKTFERVISATRKITVYNWRD